MISKRIQGTTRVLGKGQGYAGLAICDTTVQHKVNGEITETPCMQSAWELTPDELDRLNKGAMVILTLLGTGHPPVSVDVGMVPA